jgi:hypothetical protein
MRILCTDCDLGVYKMRILCTHCDPGFYKMQILCTDCDLGFHQVLVLFSRYKTSQELPENDVDRRRNASELVKK